MKVSKNAYMTECDRPEAETLYNIAQETLGLLWDAIRILNEIHGFVEKEAEEDIRPEGIINRLESRMKAARYCAGKVANDLNSLKDRIVAS